MNIRHLLKTLLPMAMTLTMLQVVFSSCTEDEEIQPSTVAFSTDLQNIIEGNEATVTLTLSRPAPQDGSVKIVIAGTAIYDKHYVTAPTYVSGSINLSVAKGSESVSFKVLSIPNEVFEGDQIIIFEILASNLSDGLQRGTTSLHKLTILDDEGPSAAYFEVSGGTISEADADGIEVNIPFSAPAQGTGEVKVSFLSTRAVYQTHFVTQQEGTVTGNSIMLPVTEGTTGLKFKVVPVDNDLYTGDATITFRIASVSGVVVRGSPTMYTLKLEDDELPSMANFATPAGAVTEDKPEGIVVHIPFSSPVKGEGSVTVTFQSDKALYGTHFTTFPGAQGNAITLSPAQNSTDVTFTVFPVNNWEYTGDFVIPFTIWQTQGVILKGNDLDFELTIVEDEESPPFVNFVVNEGSVDEGNDEGIEVEIAIHPPPKAPGVIGITYVTSSVYGMDYFFDPSALGNSVILQVAENQTKVSFKVVPFATPECPDRSIQFQISAVNGGLARGTALNYHLTIADADKTKVSFKESEGSISEGNASGTVIKLEFSKPAEEAGTVAVYPSDSGYGYNTKYTTTPAMAYYYEYYYYDYYYYLPLQVQKDAEGAEFTVKPVNNTSRSGNYTVSFSLSSSGGCLQSAPGAKYTLTIVDDD